MPTAVISTVCKIYNTLFHSVMGIGPKKNGATYLRSAHKRPTFQLKVDFIPSLSEFPPVIKANAIVGRIRMNRDVGMAISAKSPNQEVALRVTGACVLCAPLPT